MASLKYLTHIDLNGNQLQAAAIEGLGSAPSNNLQIGRIYYDTSASSNKYLRIYQSSGSWQDIVGATLTQTLTNKTLTSPVLNTGVSGTAIKDEDNMASNSATHLATQQSIKAYVDTTVNDATNTVEEVQDIVGAQIATNGSHTFITATYQDSDLDGAIDLVVPVKDEDNMSSNSATHLATQQSIKAYVDAQIATEDTLAELNDTNISSPAAGHLIIYDNTASVWDNATLTAGSNVSITNGDGAITIASTDTNTNQLTTFQVEDGDGTEVTISHGKEWKFVEGTGIDINWTDTSNGIDTDPYDLTFTLKDTAVTAASYGSASAIPYFTVDAQGRITDAGTNAISTTLTVDGDSTTEDVSLATDDLKIIGTGNEIETAVSKSGTDVSLQIGLPNDVTIGNDLSVTRNLTVTGKQILGTSGTANLYLGNEIAANSANKGARFHSDNNDFFMDFQGDTTQTWTLRDYDGSGGIHTRFTFDFVNGNFTATGDLVANDDLTVADDASIGGDLTVTGNLTVNGTTTTISTANLNVEDAIIMLQAELGGSSANATDMGIIMERGSTGDNAAIIWDEGLDTFVMGTTTETGADTDVTVSAGNLTVGTLTTTNITCTNYNLVAGDIPNLPASKITSGTFPAARIGTNAITTAKINADAVTNAKIANGAVDTEHIADDAIMANHIDDGAIGTAAIADDTVTNAKLADDAVDTAQIADNAVTLGTHTTGNYVSSLVAGTNVTLTNNSGETATPTVSVTNAAILAQVDSRSSAHTITGDGTTVEFTVTYGFTAAAVNDVLIQIVDSYSSSSFDGDTVHAEVERHSTTQCKIKFSVAPVNNHTYRVLCYRIG